MEMPVLVGLGLSSHCLRATGNRYDKATANVTGKKESGKNANRP